MKRSAMVLAAAALLAGLVSPSVRAGAWEDSGLWFPNGAKVMDNDKGQVSLYGRTQEMGVGEFVPDPYADNFRMYLFNNETRFGVKGRYEDMLKWDLQLSFGGESINGSNTDMSLLDAVADIPVRPLGDNTILKIGQFKVPYSRESLTDTGYMNFTNRSVANFAAFQGRDYGLAVMGSMGKLTGTIGTFTGGGRNVPQRYLPEVLGIPEVVARVGYNDGADIDIYHVQGIKRPGDLKRDEKAFYVNGLFMEDTRIGHSSALGVRTIDANYLTDSNFNPYIKWGDNTATATGGLCSAITCMRGYMYFVGTDGVIRHRIDDSHSVDLEYQGDWGGYWNRFGVMHIASARGQATYSVDQFDIGLRYGILSMDDKAGFLTSGGSAAPNSQYGKQIGGTIAGKTVTSYFNANMGQPIHEVTPSITWHIRNKDYMKIVASLPIFLDAPLWIDRVDGVYNFTDPTPSGANTLGTDQDSVLTTAGNSTRRAIVPEGRMMFQFMF